MLKIAVVEDDKFSLSLVKSYIEKFMSEQGLFCKIFTFFDGLNFIETFKDDYDIVFMDIKMPLLDGMEASKRMRKTGSNAKLVFITSMAQYAINGYEVEAIGFLIKPVTYFGLSEVLKKAVVAIDKHKDDNVKVVVVKKNNTAVVYASEIYYVEVQAHDLIFHTKTGDIECHKTLKEVREILEPANFTLCNNCYFVNLRYVTDIGTDTLTLANGEKLAVSRRRKKELWNKFMDFVR